MIPRSRSDSERPLPAHPYRDTAILNGILAAVVLGLAWLTDGDLGVALTVAIGFFLVATGWSWWRFRQRIAERVGGTDRGRK